MRKDYDIICLDKNDKPKQVATIEETNKARARIAGQRLAKTLNLRFHTSTPKQ